MIELLKQPWAWYVAGPLIGLTVPALLIIGNKSFGISSSLRHICASCMPANIPFFKYDWKKFPENESVQLREQFYHLLPVIHGH